VRGTERGLTKENVEGGGKNIERVKKTAEARYLQVCAGEKILGSENLWGGKKKNPSRKEKNPLLTGNRGTGNRA